MALQPQSHPHFAAEVDLPLYVNDRTYVSEAPMGDGGRRLWYHYALIPYTLVGSMFVFMGPLPKCIKKPHIVNDFFPTYHDYEPLVFVDKPFNFNLFKK